jgi:hypothetical protein
MQVGCTFSKEKEDSSVSNMLKKATLYCIGKSLV